MPCVTVLFLPGPPGIWSSGWFQVPVTVVSADDVALWPYTPGLLVKWVSFLHSLHWLEGYRDLGVGGVSFVELLILYELWAGERLFFRKGSSSFSSARASNFQCWLFHLVTGIDIWRSCRFCWCVDEVSLFVTWGASQVRALLYWCQSLQAPSHRDGKIVVMVLLLDRGRVPLSFSWMSF